MKAKRLARKAAKFWNLNDVDCKFYWFSGLNEAKSDWQDGGFIPYVDDFWRERSELIVNVETGDVVYCLSKDKKWGSIPGGCEFK